jgi:hypothetical protein
MSDAVRHPVDDHDDGDDEAPLTARVKPVARTPLQFAALQKITLRLHRADALDGIGEMTRLESLTIVCPHFVPALPDAVRRCAQLRTLVLAGVPLVRVPELVLRLTSLRSLDLSDCAEMEALPEDMRGRLPNLRAVDITGCRRLTAVPDSLRKCVRRRK